MRVPVIFVCSHCSTREKNPPYLQAIGIICPECGRPHRFDGKEWVPRESMRQAASRKPANPATPPVPRNARGERIG